MNYYETQLERLSKTTFGNQWQLDTVIGIRNYINNNYDQDLNLDLLSQIRYVSKYHLLRLFKRYYGQTPKQYLTDKRIEMAKNHLKNGMSVTETCFAVGFESLGSFSTLFKKKVAMTPQEFCKEQLSRSIESNE